MPISAKKPLALEQVAFLWSREIGPYSPRQTSTVTRSAPVELLKELIAAVRSGALVAEEYRLDKSGPTVQDALKRGSIAYDVGYDDGSSWVPPSPGRLRVRELYCLKHADSDDPCTAECLADENALLNAPNLMVARDEFLRWTAEQGYSRPNFWDVGASEPVQTTVSTPADPSSPTETPPVKKNPRGPVPVQTPKATARLRAALAADPTLRERVLTEKELQRLCGGVSRETARKARDAVFGK
jgi:hypothetical protein